MAIRPVNFVAGETLTWEVTFPAYSAAAGWELSYQFRSAIGGVEGSFDATGTSDGSGFKITVASATTAPLQAGTYTYRGFATKGSEKYLVDEGTIEVRAALDTIEPYDARSVIKRTLDAIEAMIAGTATLNQQAYMINNRRLDRYPLPDLIQLHNHYLNLYNREQRKANQARGGGFFKNVHTRFGVPQ